MAFDLFISYSRKDSSKALELAESLRSSGVEVWLDQQAIEGAASWSKEIAAAILECRAFAVLLSNHSVASPEVAREVAIAAERKKPILPIDLEQVTLPVDLLYPLAGIQRLPASDNLALMRALNRLGIVETVSGVTHSSFTPLPPDPLGRKTLAVLPFENLSRDAEDDWFADGLTQELINVLSQIKTLRVKDRKSVMNYESKGKSLSRIADELGVQYILEGTVRKQGNNIRTTAELIDIRTDDHLWSNTFKGTLEDIFEIQEKVALDIANALTLTLTLEEKSNVAKRLTDNVDAYQYYLKAEEIMALARFQAEDYELAIRYLDEALMLDPRFTEAWVLRARAKNGMVMMLGHSPTLCDEARENAFRALLNYPHSARAYGELANSYALQGKASEAIDAIERAVELDKKDFYVHVKRGVVMASIGNGREALNESEIALESRPDDIVIMMTAFIQAVLVGDGAAIRRLSQSSLPYLERQRKFHPEDDEIKIFFGLMSTSMGDFDAANTIANTMLKHTSLNEFETAVLAMLLLLLNRVDDAVEFGLAATQFSGIARYLKMFQRGHSPLVVALLAHPKYPLFLERMNSQQA